VVGAPFSGEVRDGYVWGRGAIDMKHMVATSLAVARQFKRDGTVPPRDIVFAYVADEEAGGFPGARWLAENRPELFEGVTEAVSEVGGFSLTVRDGVRAYLVETAEKGVMWLRLKVRGTAGPRLDGPHRQRGREAAAVLTRLEAHRFPIVLTDPVREFLAGVGELTGCRSTRMTRRRRRAAGVFDWRGAVTAKGWLGPQETDALVFVSRTRWCGCDVAS